MSMFSGKCDFYDSVVAIWCDGDTTKLEEFLARTDIYIFSRADERKHKLDIKNEKDAAKYYPYLQCIAALGRTDRNTIILSSTSFIDDEEEEHLSWYLDDVLKYWRKCKRNKTPFTAEKYFEQTWLNKSNPLLIEIVKRVVKDGKKATTEGLHTDIHEYYRKRWFEEMVRLGYSETEAFNW